VPKIQDRPCHTLCASAMPRRQRCCQLTMSNSRPGCMCCDPQEFKETTEISNARHTCNVRTACRVQVRNQSSHPVLLLM
jgi:hypothetical protein